MSGTSSYSIFYDLSLIDQLAVNVFYGCGYDFYNTNNQMRQDDVRVRTQACQLLKMAQSVIDRAQLARRQAFPKPTSEQPFPSDEAIAEARALEALGKAVGSLEGTIRTLPVPPNDRMTQRYRQQTQTLDMLRNFDLKLVGRAVALRDFVKNQNYDWLLTKTSEIEDALRLMTSDVQERQLLLA